MFACGQRTDKNISNGKIVKQALEIMHIVQPHKNVLGTITLSDKSKTENYLSFQEFINSNWFICWYLSKFVGMHRDSDEFAKPEINYSKNTKI